MKIFTQVTSIIIVKDKHHLPDKRSDKHFSHANINSTMYDRYRKVKEEKDRLYRYCDFLHRSAIESLATGFKAISIDVNCN